MSILVILAAALLGAIAGAFLSVRFEPRLRGRKSTMTLAIIAMVAAVGTNASEKLIELGVDFDAVDVIEAASYFVFGFAVAMGWRLATPVGWRWMFATLVPIATYEPLRIGWRLLKVLVR